VISLHDALLYCMCRVCCAVLLLHSALYCALRCALCRVQVVVEVERVVLTRGLSTLLPWELIELSNFAPACSLDPSLGGIAPAPGGPQGLQLAKYLTAEPGPEIAPGVKIVELRTNAKFAVDWKPGQYAMIKVPCGEAGVESRSCDILQSTIRRTTLPTR
jgi:hypothetical protein